MVEYIMYLIYDIWEVAIVRVEKVEYEFVKVEELIELCSIPGVSGREELVREKISSTIPMACSVDKIGNLIYERMGRTV